MVNSQEKCGVCLSSASEAAHADVPDCIYTKNNRLYWDKDPRLYEPIFPANKLVKAEMSHFQVF